ncbi:MAG: RecX family transcriptional regulator [Pseudomonadota bacterium]
MVSRESKTSSHSSESEEQGDAPNAARRGHRTRERKRAKSAPLDETRLRDLALAYVARFSTTAAKVEGYLARKIRERGVAEDGEGRMVELDVPALVSRLVELGYIDDDAYARGKSRDLTQRGYGKRRVKQALWAAGVEEDTRAKSAPGEAASRRAAMLLAKKRRFGPFARDPIDPDTDRQAAHKAREKQVAAMLRAGHLFEHIQFILEATQPDAVEEWVIEAEDEEGEDNGW